MKKIYITPLFLCIILFANAQGGHINKDFENGEEAFNKKDYKTALTYFDKSVKLNPYRAEYWHARGMTRLEIGRQEDAVADLNHAIQLNPKFEPAYMGRALAETFLTDYNAAIADYKAVIKIDSSLGQAFYDRGHIYEILGKVDSACTDFKHAMKLGYKKATRKVQRCNNDSIRAERFVVRLTETSKDKEYGFSKDKPIKVGIGSEGATGNEEMYIALLRDSKGAVVGGSFQKTIEVQTKKGTLKLDSYIIKYNTGKEGDAEKTSTIYFDTHEYEQPKILFGLKTIEKKLK